jgi:hypothetical protein
MPEWRAASRLKPVSSFKNRRALRKGSSKQVLAPPGETIDDIPLLTAFSRYQPFWPEAQAGRANCAAVGVQCRALQSWQTRGISFENQ